MSGLLISSGNAGRQTRYHIQGCQNLGGNTFEKEPAILKRMDAKPCQKCNPPSLEEIEQ